MNPDSLRRIEDALTRLPAGARFSSLTQLSEHLAVLAGVSSRTVRRAFDRLDVAHLIGDGTGPPPGVGQPVRQPDETVGQLSDSRHETPGHSADSVAPSRGRTTPTSEPSSPPAAAAAPAAPPAAGPPPSPPAPSNTSSPGAPGPQDDDPDLERMLSRSRRVPNKHPGECVGCEERVPPFEGWIPVPYSDQERTPVHCASCWELFAALDAAMALHDEIPDKPDGRKSS